MRHVVLNMFTSDGKEHEPYVFGAPKGQSFSKEGEQQIVALFMGHVQEQFPNNVFRVVRVGRGKFNVLPESLPPTEIDDPNSVGLTPDDNPPDHA